VDDRCTDLRRQLEEFREVRFALPIEAVHNCVRQVIKVPVDLLWI
jgi:hypothetical protein